MIPSVRNSLLKVIDCKLNIIKQLIAVIMHRPYKMPQHLLKDSVRALSLTIRLRMKCS